MDDRDAKMVCETTNNTQTKLVSVSSKRKICGMTIKEIIDCCSALFLPLMLGVFTVVITLYQANLARQQRSEDQKALREQREQDLNISKFQRDQDLYIAKGQREEDVLRRLQDLNATQLQRDNDINTGQLKRELDEKLAEMQRNLSEKQRAHELMIEAGRYEQELGKYRHGLLSTYMNEIENLIIKSNGTITSDPRIASIIRGKTLALIRQLDTIQKAHLIRFLYETGQLTNGQQPLDLTDAELDDIDLSSTTSDIQSMAGLTLANAYLRNTSFIRRDLTNGNFSGARLTNSKFLDGIASLVDFSKTTLTNVSFTNTILSNSSFINSNGSNVNFDGITAVNADFTLAVLPSSSFVQSSLDKTIFNRANLSAANFSLSSINSTTFMYAWLEQANFDKVNSRRLQFSNANLHKASLKSSKLFRSDFIGAHIVEANFAFSEMDISNFSLALGHRANFTNTILTYSSFISAWIHNGIFINANLVDARLPLFNARYSNFSGVIANFSNFSNCQLSSADFSKSILTKAEFRRTQAKGVNFSFSQVQQTIFIETFLEQSSFVYANLEKAIFTDSVLHQVNFTHSNMSMVQLRQAIATFGAILPSSWNSTVLRENNLIKNGAASCNISVGKYWNVSHGVISLGHHNSTDCYFTQENNDSSSIRMSQEIDVKRYIKKVHEVGGEGAPDIIVLSARVGGGTTVRVVGKPINVNLLAPGAHTPTGILQYRWYSEITNTLQVVVEFGSMNGTAWCDNIDLWIHAAARPL